MQQLGSNYGFQTVFGFVRHTSNLTSSEAGPKIEQNINHYLDDCLDKLGVRIDHKCNLQNS